VPQIETAQRISKLIEPGFGDGDRSCRIGLPQPEGDWGLLRRLMLMPKQRRYSQTDLKLARLFMRQPIKRIIAADYYPRVDGSIPGEYVPVKGIHRQESTSKTQDFIGSEIKEKAVYTWRVVDNGKVGGAMLRARAAREENELTCRKLEAKVSRELSRIAKDVDSIAAREKSLASASAAAERVPHYSGECGNRSRLAAQYRVTKALFSGRGAGCSTVYQHNVALAEWDRAAGRYFQYSYEPVASRAKTGDSINR
jgi:hypothetical protein